MTGRAHKRTNNPETNQEVSVNAMMVRSRRRRARVVMIRRTSQTIRKRRLQKIDSKFNAFLQMTSTIRFITVQKPIFCLIMVYIKISLAISSAKSFADTG